MPSHRNFFTIARLLSCSSSSSHLQPHPLQHSHLCDSTISNRYQLAENVTTGATQLVNTNNIACLHRTHSPISPATALDFALITSALIRACGFLNSSRSFIHRNLSAGDHSTPLSDFIRSITFICYFNRPGDGASAIGLLLSED